MGLCHRFHRVLGDIRCDRLDSRRIGRPPRHASAADVNRRQKEARRAMEQRIAAQAKRAIPRSSFRERMRANISTISTGDLWSGAIALLVFWAPLAWITTDYLVTPLILDARGITVEAIVDYRNDGARGPDSLDVHPLEGPRFSTTLYRWPPDVEVGERFELTYDPQQPNRAVAEGSPVIDATVIGFALLDLVILPCGLALVPFAAELVRRGRRRLASERTSDRGGTPRRYSRAMRRTCTAAVQYLRKDPVIEQRVEAFALFALIPGLLVLASGTFAVVQGVQATALYQRGASGTAVVDRTNAVSGWGQYVDIHFMPPAETPATTVRTTITHLAEPHFEGERLEIVYDPEDPENAIEAGAIPWGWAEWIATAVFVASGAFGAVSIPAVVPPLVGAMGRPANRLHGERDDVAKGQP